MKQLWTISSFASKIPLAWRQNILFPVLILCGKYTHFNFCHFFPVATSMGGIILVLPTLGWDLRSRSHLATSLKFLSELPEEPVTILGSFPDTMIQQVWRRIQESAFLTSTPDDSKRGGPLILLWEIQF